MVKQRGGGKLGSPSTHSCIMLCENMTDDKLSRGCLPLDFIMDCVEGNTFLNIDKYRRDNLNLKASTCVDHRSETVDFDVESGNNNSSFRMTVSRHQTRTGRMKYSDLDDLKIIRHLITHEKYSQIGGNVVWKDMQSFKVTNHSYQSMKARMKKHILPNIDSFDIPSSWKAKITGDFRTKWKDGPIVFGQSRGITDHEGTLQPQSESEETAEIRQNVDIQSLQQSQGFDYSGNEEDGSPNILDISERGNVEVGRNIGGMLVDNDRSELEDSKRTYRGSFNDKSGSPAVGCKSASNTLDYDDEAEDDMDRLIVSAVQTENSTAGCASHRLSHLGSSHSAGRAGKARSDGRSREGVGKGNTDEHPHLSQLEGEEEEDSEIHLALGATWDDEGNKDGAGPSKVARQIPRKKKTNFQQNAKEKGCRIHSDSDSLLSSIGSDGNCDLLGSSLERTARHRLASDSDETAHDRLVSGSNMIAGTSTVRQRKKRIVRSGFVDRGLSSESDKVSSEISFVNEFPKKGKRAAMHRSPDQTDNNHETHSRERETMAETRHASSGSKSKDMTLRRIKYLCKVYKLEVIEATTILMEFQGNFQKAVQFMES